MKIKQFAAAFIAAAAILFLPCTITENIDTGASSTMTVSAETAKFSLSPEYTDLGGSAAITYNTISSKYKAKLLYTVNGKKLTAEPQADGFIYVSGLTPGKTYSVVLKYTDGKKTYKYKFKLKLSKNTGPVVTVSSVGSNFVKLSWKDFAKGQTYAVYRSDNGVWKKLGTTSKTTYIDGNLTTNSRCKYKIKVLGSDGAVNIPETALYANTKPDAVNSIGVNAVDPLLYWVNTKSADGYYIYRLKSGKYIKIGAVSADKTSFNISGYTDETFGVSVIKKNSDGSVSESKIKTVKFHKLPPCPQEISAKYTDDGIITLSWQAAADNAKYYIYMSNKNSGTFKLLISTTATSCKVTGLKGSPTRYFMIKYKSGSYTSELSPVYTAMKTVTRTTRAAAYLQSDSSWASGTICTVPKGTKIQAAGMQNNFYCCIYNGKVGYIYNLAIDNKTENVSKSNLNPSNLDMYIDDWIYYNGRNTKTIWKYVNKFRYNAARADKRITSAATLKQYCNELAVNMIKYNSGICYHYAALSGKILSRAGYRTDLVYCPHTKSGFHCYDRIYINGVPTYFDACRHSYNNELGYLPDSNTFISTRKLDKSKEEVVELS